MRELSLKLLEYIAIGLDKDRFFFHDWFLEDSLSTYRNNHVMPRSAGIVDSSLLNEGGIKMTTAAHADTTPSSTYRFWINQEAAEALRAASAVR